MPVAEDAPARQYVPALHWPVGAERAAVAQYEPAVQGVHAGVVAPPAEKVPARQFPEPALDVAPAKQ